MLRLYYVRLGFLASAYINQVPLPPARRCRGTSRSRSATPAGCSNRPPILSYDGYALYNWKRFDPAGPIALGNIDTIQNFVHLYDEHWFILVHVEIEAAGRRTSWRRSTHEARARGRPNDATEIDRAARPRSRTAVWQQVAVLRRIPEKMDPHLYFKTFRPYIRFFENVVYEGVERTPTSFRGETGAQSSIMPTLVAFLKIPHQPSLLTDHLADMRRFMPAEHRAVIEEVEATAAGEATGRQGGLQRRARGDGDVPRSAFRLGRSVHPPSRRTTRAAPAARRTGSGCSSSSTRHAGTRLRDSVCTFRRPACVRQRSDR